MEVPVITRLDDLEARGVKRKKDEGRSSKVTRKCICQNRWCAEKSNLLEELCPVPGRGTKVQIPAPPTKSKTFNGKIRSHLRDCIIRHMGEPGAVAKREQELALERGVNKQFFVSKIHWPAKVFALEEGRSILEKGFPGVPLHIGNMVGYTHLDLMPFDSDDVEDATAVASDEADTTKEDSSSSSTDKVDKKPTKLQRRGTQWAGKITQRYQPVPSNTLEDIDREIKERRENNGLTNDEAMESREAKTYDISEVNAKGVEVIRILKQKLETIQAENANLKVKLNSLMPTPAKKAANTGGLNSTQNLSYANSSARDVASMSNQSLFRVALLVRDYDEAIAWFTDKLSFIVIEDTPLPSEPQPSSSSSSSSAATTAAVPAALSQNKRWVVLQPPSFNRECCQLVLAKADNEEQLSRVGNQTGGRVSLFLKTDSFQKDYERMMKKGVEIVRAARSESYGQVLVFRDCCGNLWDMIGTSTATSTSSSQGNKKKTNELLSASQMSV